MFSIIVIGDEILSGSVADTNLRHAFKKLRERSMTVDEVRIIPDKLDVIVKTIREMKERSQFVISSGGIGPTHDDVTMEAYARVFGVELAEDPYLKRRLTAYFGSENKGQHVRFYTLPKGTKLLGGTEERWPAFQLGNCFILPGLPRSFEEKLEIVLDSLPAAEKIHHRELKISVPEGYFATALAGLQSQYPGVDVGSYPQYRDSSSRDREQDEPVVRVTLKSVDKEQLQACCDELTTFFKSNDWLMGG
ncbi:MAG: hypothetical protein CR997_10900 [Acidobacteria bacterium]|nr:MAG: hypothetical protein CR997_10900 [Acidobacteriota bacterium]